jgi:sialic acid synthase SpsE
MDNIIFEDLFILEMANNHWGSLDRGLKIIKEFSTIVRFNNTRAAIKMQFRDVDTFVHKDFTNSGDIRYIKKTMDTKMDAGHYAAMVDAIKKSGCIAMSTPFDEASVDLCVNVGIEMIKIASSDINDWFLIEKIGKTKKPVVISTGGSSVKDIDDVVKFFNSRNIPLAVLHCVSLYPSEDRDLELNQIDFLKKRYPDNVIGLSSHECTDWSSSIMIAYAKGASVFERHVDIDDGGYKVSPYCSKPEQVDVWFKAHAKAVEMCGASGNHKRMPPEAEIKYLDALVRGVYAKRDLLKGEVLNHDTIEQDVYLAIPLQKGQLSCRELISGEVLLKDCKKDSPLTIEMIDSPYAKNENLKKRIYERGL